MFTKLLNINKNLVSSGRKDAALNPGDESAIHALKQALETSEPVPTAAWPLVVRMASKWEYADRLAALDLLRCVAKASSVAKQTGPTVVDLATTCPLPADGKPNENAIMMGVRAIANLFVTPEGEAQVGREHEKVVSFLERVAGVNGDAIGKHNRNVQVAVATALVNLVVLANKGPADKQRLVALTGTVLDGQTDSEVLYRGLVALGTLVGGGAKADTSVVRGARERGAEDRVKAVADECMQLMR